MGIGATWRCIASYDHLRDLLDGDKEKDDEGMRARIFEGEVASPPHTRPHPKNKRKTTPNKHQSPTPHPKTKQKQKIQSIIMINCGGRVDLMDILFEEYWREIAREKVVTRVDFTNGQDSTLDDALFEEEIELAREEFKPPPNDQFRVYLMDSHRPFCLANVREENQHVLSLPFALLLPL